MAHFYLNDEFTEAAPGSLVSIFGAEARHAVSVSRIRLGESLSIGNGAGLTVTGTVVEAQAARLSIETATVRRVPANDPALVLVQALAKGGRDELAIQAATELGVDTVIPWAAQRSVVRWDGQKAEKGRARWDSIVREASKQCLRAWVPRVGPMTSTDGLRALAQPQRMLVLEPNAEESLTAIRADERRDIVLVVGPEGGIAPGELDALTAAGATPARLGDPVLRTSTAGPAAIAVLNGVLGRW
ncbi:MAG TPA: 16S rRNA (uracil(1498)-N(3))-methyltransferase [Microbacteriaceae bacterium]